MFAVDNDAMLEEFYIGVDNDDSGSIREQLTVTALSIQDGKFCS